MRLSDAVVPCVCVHCHAVVVAVLVPVVVVACHAQHFAVVRVCVLALD
ncbi:hypothetical protein ICN39_10225 [Polynucleobacter sp. AP-Reno-20A-A9]|nr:hypothetical protein [Polynucleobacter sp. AP-Reno-20A-A9]